MIIAWFGFELHVKKHVLNLKVSYCCCMFVCLWVLHESSATMCVARSILYIACFCVGLTMLVSECMFIFVSQIKVFL